MDIPRENKLTATKINYECIECFLYLAPPKIIKIFALRIKSRMNNANRLVACAGALAAIVCFAANALIGQVGARSSLQLDSGEHIYKAACIACHGPDGTGTPQSIAGFERPRTFPDFTQCD
jgi:mono/diheme cytochrome c family protein